MNEFIKRMSIKKSTVRHEDLLCGEHQLNLLLEVHSITGPTPTVQRIKDFVKTVEAEAKQLEQLPVDCQDRINVISKFYQWSPVKPDMLQKFRKNSKISAQLRSKGNELYVKKRNMQMAWQLYNIAIMFAEPTGEELGLAFANRSALLLEIKDPSGALKDIDLAIQHNYPQQLMPKLQRRREKCLQMLEDLKDSDWAQDLESDLPKIRQHRDELLKLKRPNPLIPSAENFVKIGHTDELGRQLVVTKDIPVGTVAIVEQPFLAANTGLLKFEARHCDNCYRFIKSGIPCKDCVFVMYCSEECRSKAASGHHKFECNCLSSFYFDSIDVNSHLAFRIICKVGPEEFHRLFTTKDPKYFDPKKPFGTEPGCKYESDSYLPIHHLVNNSATLDKKRRLANGFKCLQMVSALEARTNFFDQVSEKGGKEFKDFVAGSLLGLMESVPCNALVIEEVRALQQRGLAHLYLLEEAEGSIEQALEADTFFDRTSLGIYSVGSLMNHSCDHNALRLFDSHGTMAVVTLRALKKGEPLTISYGAVHDSTMSLEERREYLMQEHGFKCECFACKHDWAVAGDLFVSVLAHSNEFTCPTCSKKLTQEEKCSARFLKCSLTGSRPTCGLCSKSYKKGKLEATFQKAMSKYLDASDDIQDNLIVQVVEACKELSPYLQFNLRPPHFLLAASRQLFHQALALILYSED